MSGRRICAPWERPTLQAPGDLGELARSTWEIPTEHFQVLWLWSLFSDIFGLEPWFESLFLGKDSTLPKAQTLNRL